MVIELACRDIARNLSQLLQSLFLGVGREGLLQLTVGQDVFECNVRFGLHKNKNNIRLA